MRDKSRRIINEECRSEEPVAIRMSPYDVRRKRTDFRSFSLNGERVRMNNLSIEGTYSLKIKTN